MNIEAIRKRFIEYSNVMLRKEVDISELTAARKDIQELLRYIDELESRLRWKKVEEEKPIERKTVLIRVSEETEPGTGYYGYSIGKQRMVWFTTIGIYDLDEFPEWREI